MTLEQENDLSALSTISTLGLSTRQTLAVAFHALGIDSEIFLSSNSTQRYIEFDDINDMDSIINITTPGRIYLSWLQLEKHKEKLLMEQIKSVTNTNTVTKRLGWLTFGVVIATCFIALLQYLKNEATYYEELKQLKQSIELLQKRPRQVDTVYLQNSPALTINGNKKNSLKRE